MDSAHRKKLVRQRAVAKSSLTRLQNFIEYWILKLTRSGNFKLPHSRTFLRQQQSFHSSKPDARHLNYFKPPSLRVPHLSSQHQRLRSVNRHAVTSQLKNSVLFARKHTDWFIVVNLKECFHSSIMIMPSR